ncbi:MAG: aspartate--tRNA ligase [Candidatus Sumerlaeota bacterium]|nr:aspartate--tRNA ligase [Candidatus Sumerlaeota bacterium]
MSAEMDLRTAKRTMYCGQARAQHIGQTIILKGWVRHRRDHGGLIFVDLIDREGHCQVVLNPQEMDPQHFELAHTLRDEFVVAVEGLVRARPEGTVNPNYATGEVELKTQRWEILNPSEVTPFKLDEHHKVSEEIRLRYRYLDLRRPEMLHNLWTRSNFYRAVRNYFYDHGFIETETPCLTRSTPEGARDFLVPSRLHKGTFYALPQSPQLFKQLLMVSGHDRYFQIVKCFRDEDMRANRQPEFTQVDVEMSFITPEDIYELIEGLLKKVFKEIKGLDIQTPFTRMKYDDAMLKYGLDAPDLRFGMEIGDLTEICKSGCEFKVFHGVINAGGAIRGLAVPGGADKYSNTQLKPDGELNQAAQKLGAKGIAWFRVTGSPEAENAGLESSIAKFFTPVTLRAIRDKIGANQGDMIIIIAGQELTTCDALGRLRLKIAHDLNLIPKDTFVFTWIVDFPLVEWNPKEKRWDPKHHPFTAPRYEDLDKLESDIGKVYAQAYDVVLNGQEIGGGSIRIHRRDVQSRVFRAIGITDEEAEFKFRFLLEGLSYGAPPHGGIALGVDRIMMLLLGEDSIRSVIAFPKTQLGTCLLTDAPARVDEPQLKEVGIQVLKEE